MSEKKNSHSEKPKASQRRHGKGVAGAGDAAAHAQHKKKGAFAGAKPHRKPKIKGKVCRACGGAVVTGRESLHEARDIATGVSVHPCRPCPHCQGAIKLGHLEEDHARCGLFGRRESTPVSAAFARVDSHAQALVQVKNPHLSAEGNCLRCKNPVKTGEESRHFTRRPRVNAPGKEDIKWHCDPPAPPTKASLVNQIAAAEAAAQAKKVVPATPSRWNDHSQWICGCDCWVSSDNKICPIRTCGGRRPSQETRPSSSMTIPATPSHWYNHGQWICGGCMSRMLSSDESCRLQCGGRRPSQETRPSYSNSNW